MFLPDGESRLRLSSWLIKRLAVVSLFFRCKPECAELLCCFNLLNNISKRLLGADPCIIMMLRSSGRGRWDCGRQRGYSTWSRDGDGRKSKAAGSVSAGEHCPRLDKAGVMKGGRVRAHASGHHARAVMHELALAIQDNMKLAATMGPVRVIRSLFGVLPVSITATVCSVRFPASWCGCRVDDCHEVKYVKHA